MKQTLSGWQENRKLTGPDGSRTERKHEGPLLLRSKYQETKKCLRQPKVTTP
jgi:hypothetical protein